MTINQLLTILGEHAPIRVSRCELGPFQILLFSTAGVIYLEKEAIKISADGHPAKESELLSFIERSTDGEILFGYEGGLLSLRLDNFLIRVSPGPQESLSLWTTRDENLVF